MESNKISSKSNFFDLGGSSLNSIYTVKELHDKGFFISLDDFVKAENLREVLEKISLKHLNNEIMELKADEKLLAEPLSHSSQNECIQLLATCFLEKCDMSKCLADLNINHYQEVFESIWRTLIEKRFSFLVRNEKEEIVGVSVSFDAVDNPDLTTENPLRLVFELLLKEQRYL